MSGGTLGGHRHGHGDLQPRRRSHDQRTVQRPLRPGGGGLPAGPGTGRFTRTPDARAHATPRPVAPYDDHQARHSRSRVVMGSCARDPVGTGAGALRVRSRRSAARPPCPTCRTTCPGGCARTSGADAPEHRTSPGGFRSRPARTQGAGTAPGRQAEAPAETPAETTNGGESHVSRSSRRAPDPRGRARPRPRPRGRGAGHGTHSGTAPTIGVRRPRHAGARPPDAG
jgi:hypothetical protein